MVRGGLLITAIIGAVLAIGGGPIAWALLVMIGVPFALVFLLGAAGHENPVNPHFAPPPPHR